jgi:hypothetical protein
LCVRQPTWDEDRIKDNIIFFGHLLAFWMSYIFSNVCTFFCLLKMRKHYAIIKINLFYTKNREWELKMHHQTHSYKKKNFLKIIIVEIFRFSFILSHIKHKLYGNKLIFGWWNFSFLNFISQFYICEWMNI